MRFFITLFAVLCSGLVAVAPAAPAHADAGFAPGLVSFSSAPHQVAVGDQVTVSVAADTGLSYVKLTFDSSLGGSRTPQWYPGGASSSSFSNIRLATWEAGARFTLQSVFLQSTDGTQSTYYRDGSVVKAPATAPGPSTHSLDFSTADWRVSPTPPDQPANVVASPGDGRGYVTWTAPADHGEPVIAYTVTAQPDGPSMVLDGSTRSTVVEGLTNGETYSFAVVATNAVGDSSAAYSGTITPGPGLGRPAPPQSLTAHAGVNQAKVSWSAPATDGGSPVTGYRVLSEPAGKSCLTPGSGRSCVVTGLTNGTTYTFTAVATNNSGTSDPAGPTGPVTPTTDTHAPQLVSATVSPGRVSSLGGTVTVELRITDDISGAAAPTVLFRKGYGPSVGFGTASRVSGDEYDGVYRRTVTVPAGTPIGAYDLSIYPLEDAAGNSNRSFVTRPGFIVGSPDAPTGVTATTGPDRQVTVSWTAPTDDGGNAVTGYTVTDSWSGATQTVSIGRTWTGTLTDIPANEPVSFIVRAVNAAGAGTPSQPSASITVPAVKPSTVRDVRAERGDRSAVVSWDAPASDGGSLVSGYTITTSPGGFETSVGAQTRSVTVPDLTNGVPYTFAVTATNVAGSSLAAVSEPVVPAGVPSRVTGVEATPGDRSARITWAPSTADGAPVEGYRVIAEPGGLMTVVAGSTTSAVMTGLANGVRYAFTVSALSERGDSEPSAPSASVVPFGRPGTVAKPAAKVKGRTVTLTWRAPSTNGAAITSYVVQGGPGEKTVSGSVHRLALKKLRPGAYRFTVTARNVAGAARQSPAVTVRIR